MFLCTSGTQKASYKYIQHVYTEDLSCAKHWEYTGKQKHLILFLGKNS